jgi:ABC-2 type transport system permease protein
MMTLVSAITLAIQLYLWRAIYDGRTDVSLGNFYLAEMTTYLLVGNLLRILLDSRVEHEVAAEVMHGDIAINFIRPLSYVALKFFTSLPVTITNLVFVAVPLLALFLLPLDLDLMWPRTGDFILFLISATLSFGTSFLINLLVGFASFWTTNIWGIQVLKTGVSNFFSGYLLPLSFLGGSVAVVAEALPFRGLIYSPLRILLGKYSGLGELLGIFGLQVLWLVVLWFLVHAVLRRATYRLEVLGG